MDLLNELGSLKIRATANKGKLRIVDTLGVLTEPGWAFIAANKARYMVALTSPRRKVCAECGDEAATVMMEMEPGSDDSLWFLCGPCWREGGR